MGTATAPRGLASLLPQTASQGKLHGMTIDTLRAHYEAYPYPHRDPADERKRLVTGSPSGLNQIRHYIYAGKLPEGRPLRFLAAGGGTGDAAIMMAQQALDQGVNVEVLHLDLSATSQGIARKRSEIRNLPNIRFVQDSLLNAPQYGPFDYIDCCGVLHHLDDPPAGLAALKAALTPEGGIGLMVYAPLGRTGVYPLQSALRRLTDGLDDSGRVRIARKVLAELPASNWLKRNPLITDHMGSDAGVYDLLLHSRDRAYTVPELVDFVQTAGLDIVSFIEKIHYDPNTYLKSPELLHHLPTDRFARAALAEEIGGLLFKHIVYLTDRSRAASAEAVNAPEMIPVYNHFDGQDVGKALKPDQPMTGALNGLTISLPMPRLAGAILQRIDGVRTWRALHADLTAALGRDAPTWERFWEQSQELYRPLHSINVMLLRTPAAG